MKEIYYVYNNEALASCVLLEVISELENIEISRCCLILPFLFDDRTISHLLKNLDDETSLMQLVNNQPRLFASFNKRFLSLLPVMVNSLMLLRKGGVIKIDSQIVVNRNLEMESVYLGDRFLKIQQIIPKFLELIQVFPTDKLYKIFRVQL